MPDYRTTHPGAKAGLSSLRTGVSCVLRAAVICVVACISLLMIPVNVYVSFSGLYIGGNHAYADDGTTGEPPAPTRNYYTYVSEMSQESGLTGGDFVATTIAGLAAATGLNLTQSPGIRLVGNTIGENLSYLADAADYPDWDTLDSATQQNYGSKQNYDSAKYVSLMSAYGLEDGYQRYASGGENFEFETDEKRQLERIGRIGSNWLGNIGNTIGSIKDALVPNYDEVLYQYLYGTSQGGQTGESEYNGENYPNWDDSWNVNYKLTNVGYVQYQGTSKWKAQASSEVYLIMRVYSTNTNVVLTSFNFFSKTPFTCDGSIVASFEQNVNTVYSAVEYTTSDGDTFYYRDINVTIFGPLNTSSQTISYFGGDIRKCEQEILFGESGSGGESSGELEPDIPGYPTEEIPDSTEIYYPPEGVSPTTTWNNYITVQRPENPYNPDNQTSTPEWQQETKQNIQGLNGIHFEKLFPFSMMYSIPELVNVVRNGVTSNEGVPKTQITIPFKWTSTGNSSIVLDLTDLANMLVMVRPFNRVLLVFSLLLALVMFWKSILTGD